MTKEEQWLLEEKYGGEKSEGFFADLERLKAGEPLAYLIGSIPFLGCTIYLDSRPLIPRPETEFWVEKAIGEIRSAAPKAPRVLDLCAGSGAIGIAVAKAIPSAHVTFAEIDEHHYHTINRNIRENGIMAEHCEVLVSDLFENIKDTYDFILTNPPYIDPALDRSDLSVRVHEPHLALYGGKEGLALIEKTIEKAPVHLNQGGQLWTEHEPEQADAIKEFAAQHGFTSATHNDQYKVPRYSILNVAE
jgi:release factor glutamine methyltransferase